MILTPPSLVFYSTLTILPLKRSRTGTMVRMDIDVNFPVSAPSDHDLERPEQQSEVRQQGICPNVLS